MMNYSKMSEDEKRWQRRDDAHTLARAEQIKADQERYKGAILGAKEIAKEEIERVQGIAKVAGMKTPQTPKAPENTVSGVTTPTQQKITMSTNPFDKRGYRNPATICKF